MYIYELQVTKLGGLGFPFFQSPFKIVILSDRRLGLAFAVGEPRKTGRVGKKRSARPGRYEGYDDAEEFEIPHGGLQRERGLLWRPLAPALVEKVAGLP